MTTFEVACSSCGELRWPTLAERPTQYVCVRCRAVPPERRAVRQEAAQRGRATRQKAPVASLDDRGAG